MLGVWAVLTLAGALYSSWLGYGGRAFAATLTAFAFFFLVMLLFAARGVENVLTAYFGAGGGYLLGVAVFLVYLIYALGTNTFAFTRAAAVAGFVFIPLALALAIPRWPPCVCLYRASLRQCRAGSVRASPPCERHRLFDRLGPALEFLCACELHCFRLHRHSARDGDALHPVCAAVVGMEIAPVSFARDFLLHRLARRVPLPRLAAEYARARVQM